MLELSRGLHCFISDGDSVSITFLPLSWQMYWPHGPFALANLHHAKRYLLTALWLTMHRRFRLRVEALADGGQHELCSVALSHL